MSASSFSHRYGPWALVAGASEGLGEAFARELAGRGLSLVLLARRGDRLEALASELGPKHGIHVRPVALDLAAPDLETALDAAIGGREIGLAVYNAAYAPIGPFVDRALDELLRIVDVNVRGPLVLARKVAPAMLARGRGGIVLMSSLAGFQGAPNIATYAATKAFTTVLAEGLWSELGPRGVDVLASAAGAIRTPGYQKSAKGDAPGTLDAKVVAAQTLDALGSTPSFVPGATNKLARFFLGRVLSRRAAIGVMAQSTKELG
ncbi:MAG: SDR family NAD(P)-dependent oxidoreductase [Sandaracinus sp.]